MTVLAANRGSVGSVMKVNGSESLTVVIKHYNHDSTILKTEIFSIYISVTKQNS